MPPRVTLSRLDIGHILDPFRRDSVAFPIRAKLRAPDTGFGTLLIDVLHWFREEPDMDRFVRHGADAREGEALAIHVRRIEAALGFLLLVPVPRSSSDPAPPRTARWLRGAGAAALGRSHDLDLDSREG
jgi:hypothetical protein